MRDAGAIGWETSSVGDTVASNSVSNRRRARLPQGMMRVSDLGRLYTQEAADLFARTAQDMRRQCDSREANRYLLEKLGTELSPDCDEGYYTEALNYHLALLHAHARQPERMAECIAQSRTMPAPRDNSIFSDHVTLSVITRTTSRTRSSAKCPPSCSRACRTRRATPSRSRWHSCWISRCCT